MKLTNIGVSGCKIELVENNVVRKFSHSLDYNQRLVLQLQKQTNFNTNVAGIDAPKIISCGYDEELFYFDMEYINGKLFDEVFQGISKCELDIYTNNILDYIKETQINSTETYSSTELQTILTTKLLSLRERSNYKDIVDFLVNFLNNDLGTLSKGTCHGDLTFSNILFSKQKLYLLDFLDSYVESYVMDVVKLKQDLCHCWYLNLLPIDASHITRIKQIFMYMWNRIEKIYPIVNTDLFFVLDLINILRIEPYLETEEQLKNLKRVIGEINIYEKFNSSNDGKVY